MQSPKRKPIKMKQTAILLLNVLIALADQVCFSQTDSRSISFTDLENKFSRHSSDFSQFVNALSGVEKQIAMEFRRRASESSSECQVLFEECLILKIISNEKEKEAVQTIVTRRIKFTSEAADLRLKHINEMLPLTKNTAVVVQANKLRDDLRALKETLQTLSGWLSNPAAKSENK